MVAGLDSSFDRPTLALLAQAWQASVRVWGGYVATRPNVGLAAPWSLADFDVVRTLGSTPLAFCSGWDDPAALRALAGQWRVRLCLDVETGIRPDGAWVDGFLTVSGAGLYGQNSPLGSVHHRAAAFHVGSYYPGVDPGTSWYGPRPADGSPCGWQWQGSHQEFGLSVDRGWYDDWFGGVMLTTAQKQALVRLAYNAFLWRPPADAAEENYWATQILDDGSNVDVVLALIEDSAEGNALKALRGKLLGWAQTGIVPSAASATHTHTIAPVVAHTSAPDFGT